MVRTWRRRKICQCSQCQRSEIVRVSASSGQERGPGGGALQCSAARPPEQVPAPRRTEVKSKQSNDDSSTSGLQIVPLMVIGMGGTVPCWFWGEGDQRDETPRPL